MLTTNYLPTLFRRMPRSLSTLSFPGIGFPEFEEIARSFFGDGDYPTLNARNDADGTVVTAELPGFGAEEIDISVEGSTLTISGSRVVDESGEGETFRRRERRTRVSRSLTLPRDVEAGEVEADLQNGLLTIRLPVAAAAKARKIAVKAAA